MQHSKFYFTFLLHRTQMFKISKCRFRICSLCSDSTGVIAIVLEDAEVRRLTGTTFFALQLLGSEVVLYYFVTAKYLHLSFYVYILIIMTNDFVAGSR